MPNVSGFDLTFFIGCENFDHLHFVAKALDQRADDETGVSCTQAQVRAKSECDMRVRFAVQSHLFRRIEDFLVVVGRRKTK